MQEDFATRDVNLAVVRQRHNLRADELVQIIRKRDSREFLERLDAQLPNVKEDLLVVERNFDASLTAVIASVVMALEGFLGNCVHQASQPPVCIRSAEHPPRP